MTGIINSGLDGLTTIRTSTDYTANDRDLVITDGQTVTLPDPTTKSGQVILIKPVNTDIELKTPTGQIADQTNNKAIYKGNDPLWLQSNGNNWFTRKPSKEVRTGAGDVLFSAIPNSVIDNFEADLYGNQNKTLSDRYTGDLSQFSRQQTVVDEGSFALKATGEGQITGSRKDFLQGDTVRFAIRPGDQNSNSGFLFGGDSNRTNSFSAVPFNLQRGTVGLQVFKNGSFQGRFETSFSASAGQWYIGEVEWNTNNSITVRAIDTNGTQLASVTATDSTFTTGTGYGLLSDPDTPNYFDNIRFV